MNLEYWYMLPIALLVATIAMSSEIEGATLFAPIFILGLKLPPNVAIGIGLITEVFGFASGLVAYHLKRLIDYRLGMHLLIFTIPFALIGTVLAGEIASDILKIILGIGLLGISISFLRAPDHKDVSEIDLSIKNTYETIKPQTVLITAQGEEIRYTVCNRTEGRFIASIGGLFIGLTSTGLGEFNGYFLLQRCRVPSRVAIATSVFVVAVTALSASIGHIIQFVQAGSSELDTVISIVTFTIPGVIIGGQLGSFISSYIPQKMMERGLGILFIAIAILTLGDVIL